MQVRRASQLQQAASKLQDGALLLHAVLLYALLLHPRRCIPPVPRRSRCNPAVPPRPRCIAAAVPPHPGCIAGDPRRSGIPPNLCLAYLWCALLAYCSALLANSSSSPPPNLPLVPYLHSVMCVGAGLCVAYFVGLVAHLLNVLCLVAHLLNAPAGHDAVCVCARIGVSCACMCEAMSVRSDVCEKRYQ